MKIRQIIKCFVVCLTTSLAAHSANGQSSEQLYLPPVVRVAPSTIGDSDSVPSSDGDRVASGPELDSDSLPPRQSDLGETPMSDSLLTASKGGATTLVGSLAIVLGLFLLLAWFAKRNMPAGQRWLATDVVEVLGRTQLSGKQVMHLVRLGPKLLLVSVTGQGAETLSEISDPAEVERLLAICQQNSRGSVSESFRDVLTQFEREPVEGFLDNPATARGAR